MVNVYCTNESRMGFGVTIRQADTCKEASVAQSYIPPAAKRRKPYVLFTCPQCGEQEERQPNLAKSRKFCSHRCYTESVKSAPRKPISKVQVQCGYCKATFDRWPSEVKKARRHYCSASCRSEGARVLQTDSRGLDYTRRYFKEYVERNREKHNERSNAWSKANREKRNANQRLRRSKGQGRGYRGKLYRQMIDLYGSACLACGITEGIEMDHVVPVAMGGTLDIGNVQPLCRSCNASKGATHVDYRATVTEVKRAAD